jgi:hypothetical protein
MGIRVVREIMMKNGKYEDTIIPNLKDADCDNNMIEIVLNNFNEGKEQEGLKLLASHRRILLEKLHDKQKNIDCLDYLVYRINNKKVNSKGAEIMEDIKL